MAIPAIKGGTATWAFVQLVYCHSELSEEYPGRVVYRGVTIGKIKISIAFPARGKPDDKSSNVCKKLYGKNIIPYGREIK